MNGENVEAKKLKAINLIKIAGIQISFDYSWLMVFRGGPVLPVRRLFPPLLSGPRRPDLLAGRGSSPPSFFFASVVIHELAHSLVAIRSGIQISEITLFIFGGVSKITEEPKDPVTELKVAIVGPLSSFALAVIFWVVKGFFAGFDLPLITGIFSYLAWINLALGIFNLIPGFPWTAAGSSGPSTGGRPAP